MSDRPNKSTRNPEKSAVSAVEIARDMLCELSGPRGWNDTRESWLARGARRAGLTLRRARAIFYQEPIRLEADEYLAIKRAHQSAYAAVEEVQHLVRDADLRIGRSPGAPGRAEAEEGRRVDETPRGGPATPSAARG